MMIHSNLIITLDDKRAEDVGRLIGALTHVNPKRIQTEKLGLYAENIPRTIQTFKISFNKRGGRIMTIPRGCYGIVKEIFPDETLIDKTEDCFERTGIVYRNEDFALDERQRRCVEAMVKKKQGIIHAATSAGKSAIIMAAIAEIELPTLIIVHRKLLLTQLYADAKKWLRLAKGSDVGSDNLRNTYHESKDDVHGRSGRDVRRDPSHNELLGRLGGGQKTFGLVTFAIDKTLSSMLEKDPTIAQKFGCIIQDECHLSPCTTFQQIMSQLPAQKRFGLTGTLKRKDGMEFLIHATYGKVIATVTKDELLEANRVSPVYTKVIQSEAEVPAELFELPITKKMQAIDKSLHENEERLNLIVEYAKNLLAVSPESRIIIASRYVDPCYEIAKRLDHAGIPCATITGRDRDSEDVCRRLRSGELRSAAATLGCFSTGVNIPELTDIILISPCFSNELLIHQLRGRLYRKAEGKTHGTLHLVWDDYVFPSFKLKRFLSIMKK